MNTMLSSDTYTATQHAAAAGNTVPDDARDLQLAVRSIPSYVEIAQLFLVNAPTAIHKDLEEEGESKRKKCCDYGSWCSRGWCRAEAISRLLARNSGPMVVLKGTHTPSLLSHIILLSHHSTITTLKGDPLFARIVPITDIFNLQIGKGEFTCCRHGHRRGGPPCDKVDISAFTTMLLDKNIHYLRDQMLHLGIEDANHDIAVRFRFFFCFRRYLLAGLPIGMCFLRT